MDEPQKNPLDALATFPVPDADPAARAAALAAATAAFDAAGKVRRAAPQALPATGRLRSVLLELGNRIMDHRLPIAGAALALIALPLAWQLHSTSMLTRSPVVADRSAGMDAVAPAAPLPQKTEPESAGPAAEPAAAGSNAPVAAPPPAPRQASDSAPVTETAALAPPPPVAVAKLASRSAAPLASLGEVANEAALAPQASGDSFAHVGESPLKQVASDPVSTFSVDVDTASYAYVRASLKDGMLPPPDAVRIEEMINYFPYAYPGPETTDEPFRVSIAAMPTPWNARTELLRIGIKGYVP
ncbi:MAG: von Willebrand factor type A domain-containing protein, partial [Rhizobiales bacterium]|nr:von Willebrand factor type A domain-containing protein [Hyphomicrobiales bacterium]